VICCLATWTWDGAHVTGPSYTSKLRLSKMIEARPCNPMALHLTVVRKSL